MIDHLIKDLALLLLVSLPINIVFHRIKLPSIMGFIIAGVIIGPHGLLLIDDLASVDQLAEIGVILLLFVIGLEFSLSNVLKNVVRITGVGGLQIGLTALAVYMIGVGIQMPFNEAVVFGLLTALSSTAVVLKMITDRAEIDTPHGQACIGVLLFQDLFVVPLMLIIPLLSGAESYSAMDFVGAMFKSIAAVGAIFWLSRMLVPKLLELIARLGSKEHLTLLVILIVLGTGWASHEVGLTVAMGAFIAGLILSESEYNHQIIVEFLPLKDYFVSIFFISLGMLLHLDIFLNSFFMYLGWAVALIGVKFLMAFLASALLRNSFRISFVVGLRLAQIGEFSLILAALALEQKIFPDVQYQSFLIVSIISLLAAPVLIQISSLLSIRLFAKLGTESTPTEESTQPLSQHVIVAGYSLIGRTLSRVLKEANISSVILELDGEAIKHALTEKMTTIYGDATHRDILMRAGISRAKMIVFALPDNIVTQQGIMLARRLNPDIYILVRTRFASQVEELKNAGADQVIPEEFETSIEIFSRVLREYRVPTNVIEQQVELARLEGYSMFRGLSLSIESMKKFSTFLTASLTQSFQVLNDSWCNQQTLGDLQLSRKTGGRIIAVVRTNDVHANPGDDFDLTAGDIIVLFGRHAQLDQSLRVLQSGYQSEEERTRLKKGVDGQPGRI